MSVSRKMYIVDPDKVLTNIEIIETHFTERFIFRNLD